MKLLEKILVAIDFTDISNNLVANAVDMAKTFQSKIALIYVLPDDLNNKKAADLLKEFATRQLDAMNTEIKEKGINTLPPILEFGSFSDKIVEVSERINANIVFVGAGEKLIDNKFQLGSNAVKIIMKSNKPVYVVKNDQSLKIHKILCPVDFSEESKIALQNAITFARKFNAELIILSVYNVSALFSIRNKINIEEEIELSHKECTNELNLFLEKFNLTGMNVTKDVKEGDPAEEILNAIKKHNSDLLIIGTTGKSGISRILMGSVTEKVIREIPSSFITLKKENIVSLELEGKILDIESHYKIAQQLLDKGKYEDAIKEFYNCLEINVLHIPSLQGLYKAYKALGDNNNAQKYKNMIMQVLDTVYNEKIENEIRKLKGK